MENIRSSVKSASISKRVKKKPQERVDHGGIDETGYSSPRSTPEELEGQINTTSTTSNSGRKPVFSSNQEAPIVMSSTALANVLQDVHFAEEEDLENLPLEVKQHTLSRKYAWQKTPIILRNLFRTWDLSYTTSALTRLSPSSPVPHFLGLLLQDLVNRLTLQSHLRSPFVFHRMISLLWNGGPITASATAHQQEQQHQYLTSSLLSSSPSSNSNSITRTTYPPNVHGIPNYGQTCFLNTVLQSLASLDSLVAYTETIAKHQATQKQLQLNQKRNRTHRHRHRHHKIDEETTTVSEIILPLLQALNGQTQAPHKRIDPRELLWRIAQKNPQFQSNRHLFGWTSSYASATGEQQDAQELLQALLEMMITDANLEDSYTTPKTNTYQQGISDFFKEEKKMDDEDQLIIVQEDDEVLTQLSDRWSPRNSSNNSLCDSCSIDSTDPNSATSKEPTTNGWNQIQMVDGTGMITAYENNKNNLNNNNNSLLSSYHSSLESSFLSTTSTVVTSPAREHRQSQQHQSQPTNLSGSMQIMLSTLSSITKTPLSCWTGSLVQCQKCRHNRAIRNQEWRDIPIVPTALSSGIMPSKSNYAIPPCTLEECLQHFTQVEQVADVECGNCTLQRDIQNEQEEVDLLRGAVESLQRRNPSKQLQANQGLLQELAESERKLWQLQQEDPDEYEPFFTGEPRLRANALKCLVLTRLPAVLCLHVQRRFYDPMTNQMSKTTQHVAFGEMLDLAPYCAYGGGNANAQSFLDNHYLGKNGGKPPAKPIWYRLSSVIVHHGNAFGGHYVCYRRLPGHLQHLDGGGGSDRWYFCSDESITVVSWQQVRQAEAYMLFYEAV